MLTKTHILAGLQCQKQLWLGMNPSPKVVPLSRSLGDLRIMEQGQEVERKAYGQFPDGVHVVAREPEAALEETRAKMDGGATCLFQPAFSAGEVLIRCDILRKENNEWELIEVKSSTKVKDEHISDLAVQWHILENCEIPLFRASLMLVNSQDCFAPDFSNFIWKQEVTDEVREFTTKIPELLQNCNKTLARTETPDVPIGRHCYSPWKCPFTEHCWHHVPRASFNTIPFLKWDKKEDLIARGCLLAADADANIRLSANQSRYVEMVRSGKPDIVKQGIMTAIEELKFPLHFLDFETINPAVPRFDGMRPYQQFPFQFSCHILGDADSKPGHCEYLHLDKSDPRQPLLSQLLSSIGKAGSVIVFHKPMESGVLNRLREIADEKQQAQLDDILGRLWDLRSEIFNEHYRHPDFLGSTSMKAILPVVVPNLDYKYLRIQEGNDASAAWDLTIRGEEDYADDLRKYCGVDTLGMVEIYRHLRAIC